MPLDVAEIRQAYHQLAQGFDTVLLGTVSASGQPDASYAPYIERDGVYYIYVSELASHTGNLLATQTASLLFIENEVDAKSLYARRRVTYQSTAKEIARGSEEFEGVLDAFDEKFGSIIRMLCNLEDFHLLALTPQAGRFVAGFGQAYTIAGAGMDEVGHINDRGHGKRQGHGKHQQADS